MRARSDGVEDSGTLPLLRVDGCQDHCNYEMHQRTWDVVFRHFKHQDKRELDWVKKMENKERMTDKQERWKQVLLKVEGLCPSLEDRVFCQKFDFVTTVAEWVSMACVLLQFIAHFIIWRPYSSWAHKSNRMRLQEATAEWVFMEQTGEWPSRANWTGDTRFVIHFCDEVEEYQGQQEVHNVSLGSKTGKPPKDEEDFSATKKSAMSNHLSVTLGAEAIDESIRQKLVAAAIWAQCCKPKGRHMGNEFGEVARVCWPPDNWHAAGEKSLVDFVQDTILGSFAPCLAGAARC